MAQLEVTVNHVDGTSVDRTLQVSRITNLGMTYRDPPDEETLRRHADAMESVGVSVPDELPLVAPKPNHLITTADTVQVNAEATVGELEFVLFPTDECTYVGVGNDHKYANLGNVHLANSTCPSVVSEDVWVLEEIRDHWDDLEIRNWVRVGENLELHQSVTVEAFMRPDSIVEAVDRSISPPVSGTAIWSGTVGPDGVDPAPSLRSSAFHVVEMTDPAVGRRLVSTYDVVYNDWIDGVQLP